MEDKPRLLIVEDDVDLVEMLSAYFSSQKYEVLTANWGEDAIRISREEPIHLVMLDIRLPDIDGYEICRQMRSHFATKDTPIIFLTEKRDRIDKLQGLELGVVDYITKPFDIQELRLRVRNAITRAAQQNVTNPVTDLPEGDLIVDRLRRCIHSEAPWAVILLNISKIAAFREEYGFVAADDVLRAISLMVRNAMREFEGEDDFIGHLDAEDFVLVTRPEVVEPVQERMQSRLQQSREYFYPMKDRDKIRDGTYADHLQLSSVVVTSEDGPFETVDELMALLQERAQT